MDIFQMFLETLVPRKFDVKVMSDSWLTLTEDSLQGEYLPILCSLIQQYYALTQ